jgi:hypothetical protein
VIAEPRLVFVSLALQMGCPRDLVGAFTTRFMATHAATPVTDENLQQLLDWMAGQPWKDGEIPSFPDKQKGKSLADITEAYKRWMS